MAFDDQFRAKNYADLTYGTDKANSPGSTEKNFL